MAEAVGGGGDEAATGISSPSRKARRLSGPTSLGAGECVWWGRVLLMLMCMGLGGKGQTYTHTCELRACEDGLKCVMCMCAYAREGEHEINSRGDLP